MNDDALIARGLKRNAESLRVHGKPAFCVPRNAQFVGRTAAQMKIYARLEIVSDWDKQRFTKPEDDAVALFIATGAITTMFPAVYKKKVAGAKLP